VHSGLRWILLALVLCACGTAPTTTSGRTTTVADTVSVELDIFSGMQNPAWTLRDAEAAEFQRRLESLPRASGGRIANDLGYRGFVVRAGATTALVQRETVQVTRDGDAHFRTDTGRELERWLLESGKPFVDPGTFALAEREFS